MRTAEVAFPQKLNILFKPSRYKVLYGGRGGAKSWGIARALILMGMTKKIRVLCAREIQHSIADSVHKLLTEQIISLGVENWYSITKNSIVGENGTEFIFSGLKFNIRELKSKEGIDVCWVEEAQSVSEESWEILIPTIRKEGSEIWISFNPELATDPTYKRFIENPPPTAQVEYITYQDNPWFPDVLKQEMEYDKANDYEKYRHIWLGEVKKNADSIIFAGRYTVEQFDTPDGVTFYHGMDFGFAQDPTTCVRCFIRGTELFIDREFYGLGVEMDRIVPLCSEAVPTSLEWRVYADSSRPETINHIKGKGMIRVTGVPKWAGSIEDGIEYIRNFTAIHIHERCKHTIDEFSLYSYKVDKTTGVVTPKIEDKDNHCIDALRYALVDRIRNRKASKTKAFRTYL